MLEVVESSHENIEITVMQKKTGLRILSEEEFGGLVKAVEKETTQAEAAKKAKKSSTSTKLDTLLYIL